MLAWPIYSNFNSKKHSYLDEQKELLNLTDEELVILHNETWKSYHKFRFVPFIGHSETDRIGKFVNFTEKNGRKVKKFFSGIEATCLQHEIDHLDGKLFVDHISKLKKNRIIKKLEKLKKQKITKL